MKRPSKVSESKSQTCSGSVRVCRSVLISTLILGVAFVLGETSQRASAQTASGENRMAESFRLSRVGYVMLGVSDVGRSIAFYEGKLGLKCSRPSDDLAMFDAGEIKIVVSSEVGKRVGDSETVFAVEHVRAAYRALSESGIVFSHPPHSVTDVSWAASFLDPDGHVLSIFGPE